MRLMQIGRLAGVLAVSAVIAGPAVGQVVEPAESGDFPPLRVVSPPLDLGYQAPGAVAQGFLTYLNEGEEPLRIDRIETSCYCTTASAAAETLEPGETMDVFVSMEVLKSDLGIVTRSVLIRVEGFADPFETIIGVEVGYPIRVNGGSRFAFVHTLRGTMELESLVGRPFRVRSISGRDPVISGFDPAKDEPRASYEVGFDFSDLDRGELPRWVIIETDHPGAEMVEVPVIMPGVRLLTTEAGLHARENRVLLGRIAMNRAVEVPVVLTGVPLKGGEAVKLISLNPDFPAQIVGADRPEKGGGVELRVRMVPRRDFEGFLHTVLEFELDGMRAGADIFARVVPASDLPVGQASGGRER